MSKGVSKGHLIDEHCKYKNSTLVDHDGTVYSCMLSQTDIKANANKFYMMQLIKNGSSYVHYIRYGRISEIGRITYKSFNNLYSATTSFERQFKTKTGNRWCDKDSFVIKNGKYFLIDVSYEDELKSVDDANEKNIPKSKLPVRVQELIKIISDIDMMNKTLVELDIDTKKMPLGKLNQKQIDYAKNVLDEIEQKLKNKGVLDNYDDDDSDKIAEILDDDIIDLCSKYYTYIPYGCNRRKKPPLINSKDIISKYRETLTDLANIAIGVQIINNVKADENPIDAVYADINTTIKPLRKNTKIWKEIDKYVQNTHGPTHTCKLKVLDIFEVKQFGKEEKFSNYCKDIDNHMLLFHGTPQSCVLSIFKRDFFLDPTKLNDPSVVIAGKLLGYGVYFADMASKSFNYTRANSTNDVGCLIMGEVAVGSASRKNGFDYGITKETLKKENCHSALGIGKWGPKSTTCLNGITIPNGEVGEINKDTYLRYNEYVIYDVDQVLIKYLILVKNFGGYGGY